MSQGRIPAGLLHGPRDTTGRIEPPSQVSRRHGKRRLQSRGGRATPYFQLLSRLEGGFRFTPEPVFSLTKRVQALHNGNAGWGDESSRIMEEGPLLGRGGPTTQGSSKVIDHRFVRRGPPLRDLDTEAYGRKRCGNRNQPSLERGTIGRQRVSPCFYSGCSG